MKNCLYEHLQDKIEMFKIKPNSPKFFYLFKILWNNWSEYNMSSYSASVAYFSIFSIAPLLIVCISIINYLLGKEYSEAQVLSVVNLFFGAESLHQIRTMMSNFNAGIKVQAISFILFFIGASGLFTQIQIGLSVVLKSKFKEKSFLGFIITRIWSFLIVLAVALLLIASLFAGTVLSFLSFHINSLLTSGIIISWLLESLVSLIGLTILFTFLYKMLTEIALSWKECIFGAGIASFLFIIVKFFLSLYLGMKHIDSIYGAAGSLVLILIWLYYSARIFFFGAEIISITRMEEPIN